MANEALLAALTERELDIARLMLNDLSPREIAEELVLSYGTVRWYLKQIYSKLDVHSYEEAIERIEELNLLDTARQPTRHNLPLPPAPLIGRTAELEALSAELNRPESRLITLTGPGGIGKTRLALELAHHNLAQFADGAYFVPLQPLRSVHDISAAIIDALLIFQAGGADTRQFLRQYLADRQLLLVLDNFEHLLAGVDLVSALLAAAPGLTILVTSREVLNLHEEWVWQVGGLDVPDPEADDQVDTYSAVELFAERARQVKHDFALAAEQPHVIRICQLVEGMPLALELAASWVRTLPCATIAAEINRSLGFLTARASNLPERHRNIRAVFDHSWGLMSAEAQAVFGKLSVFQGGFTFEAAQQVAGAAVPVLAELVDQSLVRRTAAGRYDLHELLRQYGAEQLEQAGLTEILRDDHCQYYAALMYELGIDIKGRNQLNGLNAVGADLDNFRAAWIRAADQRDYACINQMLDGFFWFRNHRGRYNEVFQQAWDRLGPPAGEEPHPVATKTFVRIHEFRSIPLANIEQALASAQQAEDAAEIDFCEMLLGYALGDLLVDIPGAIQMLEDRLANPRRGDDPLYAALRYDALANAYDLSGNSDKAIQLGQENLQRMYALGNHILATWNEMFMHWYEERHPGRLLQLLAVFQEMDVPPGQVMTLCTLSRAAWVQQQDVARAKQFAQQALDIGTDINFYMGIATALVHLSAWHSLTEDYTVAWDLAQRARPFAKDTIWEPGPDLAASMAACGLGDFETVRRHYQTDYARAMYGRWNLDLAAALMAHDGLPEKAVHLLARRVPNDLIYRTDGWPLLDRLRAQLEAELGPEAFQAAWEHGASLTIEQIRQEMLACFSP
jgi:predicted ATPase/DNA-binding CsgD family transcriptional regulator